MNYKTCLIYMLAETWGMCVGVDSKGVRAWRVEYNSMSDQINLYGTLTRDSRSCIIN